jgi:hypothetical protein
MPKLTRTAKDGGNYGQWIMPDGETVHTIERPWLDNKVGVSCIPAGHYLFERDHYGRFQYFRVLDVEGRTFIEIHLGTKPSHSNGCILTNPAGMALLMKWFDDDKQHVLEIVDA